MALFGGGGWFYETIKCFDLETQNHSKKSFAFVKSGKRFITWIHGFLTGNETGKPEIRTGNEIKI